MPDYSELSKLPPRKAYRLIAPKVFAEENRIGRDNLAPELKWFSLAATLHGETLNGGISQYFTNSSGKDYKLALAALHEVGAKPQEKLVRKWLRRLPGGVRPEVQSDVGNSLFTNPAMMKELERIDDEYFSSVDSFYQAIVHYVLENAPAFGVKTSS
jgi:hypothetical protein